MINAAPADCSPSAATRSRSLRRARSSIALACAGVLLAGACTNAEERRRERVAAAARAVLEKEGVDPFDKIRAAGVLRSIGSSEGNAILEDALGSGAELAERAAVGALLSVPGEAAMRQVELYSEETEANLNATLQALRFAPRSGSTSILIRGLRNASPGTQVAALDAAALSADAEVLPVVEEVVLAAREEHVRGYGVYAAAALGSGTSYAMIEPLLTGTEFEREIAAAALGFVGAEQANGALETLAADRAIGVRLAAWASMSRHGNTEVVDHLYRALSEAEPRVATLAAGSLRRVDPEHLGLIAERAGDWSTINVFAAGRVIEAIGWTPDAQARSALERALAPDQDELLRLQSLWAVGQRAHAEELSLAEQRLEDADPAIRIMAAWAVMWSTEQQRL